MSVYALRGGHVVITHSGIDQVPHIGNIEECSVCRTNAVSLEWKFFVSCLNSLELMVRQFNAV